MRHLVAALLVIAAAGCTSPPGQGGPDAACTIDTTKPAPIFAIDVPAEARAGQAFQVTAWVVLSGTVGFNKQSIKPGSFRAALDGGNTLNVSGEIISPEPNPAANCAFPAIALAPEAATTVVDVAGLPAGEYRVQAGNYPETLPTNLQQPEKKPIPTPRRLVTLVVR